MTPAGTQNIYTCAGHLAHTVRVIRRQPCALVAVKAADPSIHGCKGHMEAWPVALGQ